MEKLRPAALALVLLLPLVGCVSAEEQHAVDQQRCAGYGFQDGTDAFAHCMMTTDIRRQAADQADKDRDANMKAWSQQNNGNAAIPVCSASTFNARLDINTNSWYGPGCRGQ